MAVATNLHLRNGQKAAEIQGDILAGLNKDYRVYLFLELPDQAQGRAWLQEVIPYVSMTNEVAPFNEAFSAAKALNNGAGPTNLIATWINVSFTYPGLKMLLNADPAPALQASGISSFVQGPLSKDVVDNNGDIGPSDPMNWVVGNANQTIHAMLNIQSDSQADLAAKVQELKAIGAKYNVTIVYQQEGATLTGSLRGHEQFGYKDGISQPGVAGFDPSDPDTPSSDPSAKLGDVLGNPGTEIIAAGEFILGEPDENGQTFSAPGLQWMANGTFQVFRRLNQDVAGFNKQQNDTVNGLPADHPLHTPGLLGAKLVGRWKSGTPVDLSPVTNINPADNSNNNFDYMHENAFGGLKADVSGLRCPRIGHVRKVYPRQQNFAGGREHRIIRRGVPFGLALDPDRGPGHDEKSERGLLFFAYMTSIEDRFEFLMGAWVNNAKFPSASVFPDGDPSPLPGPDPIIAQNQTALTDSLHFAKSANDIDKPFEGFVHTTGTVYAFVPSRTALQGLANGIL
ncbi:MAG: Dyp-type peroxidase [Chloroflexi bacterium]|nr:MAG: Dyp-type peroxidase [Chloroflexota bacterium]